jgi:ribosomal protein L32
MRVDVDELRRDLQRRRTLVAHTMYECGQCGERSLGERRCQACGLFARALGLAGTCPGCDEPILLIELLELE